MDRKKFLSSLLDQKEVKKAFIPKGGGNASKSASLTPYAGTWDFFTAAHLLRRTTFGPTYGQIKQSVTDGMNTTISMLFQSLPLPLSPIRYLNNSSVTDTYCAVGSPWPGTIMSHSTTVHRRYSLNAWQFQLILDEGVSIRERLTLFWINHFGVGVFTNPMEGYQWVQLLRGSYAGDFKQLVKDITVESAMLHFLDGKLNEVGSVNENFAREILELFTCGKGPLAGPGDYTTYTESDIREFAKSFTGWAINNWYSDNPGNVTSTFNTSNHDNSTKTLSARFNNQQITGAGANEYSNAIDLIFSLKEVAISNLIVTKLYRWFVYYDIDSTTQSAIIDPLALQLRTAGPNQWKIQPIVETLLKSEHFYDTITSVGPMIKSPMDYMMSVLKQTKAPFPGTSTTTDKQDRYSISLWMCDNLEMWGMNYFTCPGVAGWKPFYQEPLYNRMWISSFSMQAREAFINRLQSFGYQITGEGSGNTIKLNIKQLTVLLELDPADRSDPNKVVEELCKLFFPVAIPQTQRDALKVLLLGVGNGDYVWSQAYYDYAGAPSNQTYINTLESRLKNLLDGMLIIAESHLC